MVELAGKHVAVWGIGVEGQAAARFALRCNAGSIVGVVDTVPDNLSDWNAASDTAPLVSMADGADALRSAEVVLRSPGISIHRPIVAELIAAGIPVIGGTSLFVAERAAQCIAVTGSKGKSTTSALIAHLLAACGLQVIHAGNIGTAVLDLLNEPMPDWYVLEVSSFQASDTTVSPRIVVLTSLFPDHLDWHGDESTYYTDKLRLAACAPTVVVANATDNEQRIRLRDRSDVTWYATPSSWRAEGRALLLGDEQRFRLPDDRLIGAHNANNVAAALTALDAVAIDTIEHSVALQSALETFSPLPHRLESVATVGGVEYIDDSLSTSPHAAIAALEAFADRPTTLIAGGHDRGMSFAPLVAHIRDRTEWTVVVTLPLNGPRLSTELNAGGAKVTTVDVADLNEAVALAFELTPPGGVVLLSPGAPSFGQFSNYVARSEAFIAAISRLSS